MIRKYFSSMSILAILGPTAIKKKKKNQNLIFTSSIRLIKSAQAQFKRGSMPP